MTMADGFITRLVGETPQGANQPTKHDGDNDRLVVLMEDGRIAIGDPAPQGTVIGHFVHIDGDDYGVIEWHEGWHPVTLIDQGNEVLDQVAHLQRTARAQTIILAAMLGPDRQLAAAAISQAYRVITGDPCDICDGKMPDEDDTEYLRWLLMLAQLRAKVQSHIEHLRVVRAAAPLEGED